MQVLYLIPPAMMLWLSFGEMFEIAAVIAPVVVMAVGQLAGGLAWLTLCGEEAPDLIQSAPLKRSTRLWAKAWAVILIACAVVSPFVLGLLFISSYGALITLLSALAATACVIIIQFWFGAQADRSLFRKRQIASKAATFIEAGARDISGPHHGHWMEHSAAWRGALNPKAARRVRLNQRFSGRRDG